MKKAVKVFIAYAIFLLLCSFILAKLNINSDLRESQNTMFHFQPIMFPTVIGGLIALWLTVPPKIFKGFILAYLGLWAFRILILYIASKIGEVHFINRVYKFNLIVKNYYKTASRLDTPLPFIIFWFIYYFYTKINTSKETPIS